MQPLLTPDNFLDHIIPLIEAAEEKLYIQNQYFWIQTAATGPVPFRKLADAITKRLEDGVDVRMVSANPTSATAMARSKRCCRPSSTAALRSASTSS